MIKRFGRGKQLGTVLAGALTLAGIGLLAPVTGTASAADNGPVIFLGRHGAPIECELIADGYADGGKLYMYRESIFRRSCDGTLRLPPGADTLKVRIKNNLYTGTVEIKNVRDGWAYCFLVKADSKIYYTNSSEIGGDCNGS